MNECFGLPASSGGRGKAKVDGKSARGPLHALFRKPGNTKLIEAACVGDCTRLRAELGKGKDLEVDWTPLFCATFFGHTEAVLLLLAEGADMEAKDPSGATPLICAADKGRFEIAKALLDRGANVDATNKTGWSALTCAAARGHADVAGVLMLHGAKRVAAVPWKCSSRPEFVVPLVWQT